MSGKVDLLTGWLTIGKAGKTIDGRTISAEKLQQAAEDYDPELYTAVINNDHLYGNFGTVRKLRLGKHKDGSVTLEAILAPNMYMIFQNSDKRKLFTSMELLDNFNGKGRTYLTGLALTDQPASLGTTELHFSVKDKPDFLKSAESEELTYESFKPAKDDESKSVKDQVIDTLKSIPGFKNFFQNSEPKEDEMTEEQLQKILEPFSASIKEMKETVEKLSATNPAGEEPPAGEEKVTLESLSASMKIIEESVQKLSATNPAGEEPPAGEETPAAEKTELADIKAGLADLTTKLSNALSGQPGTQFQKNNGNQEQSKFV